MQIISSAFHDGQTIPVRHTLEGGNISPDLRWSDVPERCVQLALIVDDPDAPRAEPFVHWVIYAIPARFTGLHEWLPKQPQLNDVGGATQGINDFNRVGYDGPRPPAGTGPHRYRFELFALDRKLQLQPNASHKNLRAAMQGKILDRCTLTGIYQNPTELAELAAHR